MNLRCPIPDCGADNEVGVELCVGCGTPLRQYGNLSGYPAQLFNRGLAAARADDLGTARELFAAIVHWCPQDWEARNALALANFQLGDGPAARHHWTLVLGRRPKDPIATRGLAELDVDATPQG